MEDISEWQKLPQTLAFARQLEAEVEKEKELAMQQMGCSVDEVGRLTLVSQAKIATLRAVIELIKEEEEDEQE